MPQHDVADGESAVPKQDALVGALTSGLGAAYDLADLSVDGGVGEPAALDQRIQGPAASALRPVVDDQLVHPKRKLGIDRHHPSVGDYEGPRFHSVGGNQHLRTLEAGRLDDDVGVAASCCSVVN